MKKLLRLLAISCSLPILSYGTENLPQIPFAESARLPEPGKLVVTPWYNYSVFRKLWIGDTKTSIEVRPRDDFELNDGMIRLDYSLNSRVALDLNLGYTSAATRAWNPQNQPQTTQGLMDTQFGVRYLLLGEKQNGQWYVPTLTARVGAIIKGTYDADFPMAPGDGASGAELSLMLAKSFECCGLGVYGQFGYRIRDHHVPQTLFGCGGISETMHFDWIINSLTIYGGYRGLSDLNGGDLTGMRISSTPSDYVNLGYNRTVQEIYHMGELGVTLTDKHGRRYFLSCASPFSGQNTGKVNNFIIGLNWPIDL